MDLSVRGSVVCVTGSNRGVGRALVEALLERGVARVYAGARDPESLPPVIALDPARVVPLHLDLLDAESITRAAQSASDVTLLINNAAILEFGEGLTGERENLARHLTTNTLGTFDVIRAFAPVLERHGGGRIVTILSLQSFAGSSGLDGYSASKAALHSLLQSLRPALELRGVTVSGVYPGGVDTDMLKGLEAPKSSARLVAGGTLDGVERGEKDIFPDPVARLLGDIWVSDPLRYERLFARTDELVAVLDSARADGRLEMS
ncbi:MAG: short-chain dehydrogenase/reductase [Marmoricola sp.]|jgi:NAD(P)-dependent dehydrogenase (short-subunit alcohol dehydrogenase family)|nr:short-chain dehydrogenase/reductase [Marmoricola sp.]